MNPSESFLSRAARWLAFASAVSILFSIAVSQILLALALAALLISGAPLRMPPIKLPLGLFLLGTLVSLAFSAEPAAGLPQVRKMYVYLMLPVVFSTIRDVKLVRRLFLCWGVTGTIIALRGFVQFGSKMQQAGERGQNFYESYVAERITGFMSHWMTFSGQLMFATLMLLAFLLFAVRRRAWAWSVCIVLMGTALLLGWTRSMWLATGAGVVYLLWFRRRWLALAVPVAAIVVAFASPPQIRQRVVSMLAPKKEIDSNEHRIVTWRTGLVMIREHPFLGLGPEGVKLHFRDYVPADIGKLPQGWYGHLHNIYLHYAAERGIPTMLALMWMIALVLRDFIRGLRKLPPGPGDERFILHGGVALVIATLVAGIFELNLGDTEVLTMFLTAVACGYTALEANRAEAAVG